MSQSTISTAILIIAGVIATAALINALFPSIYGMAGSVTSVSQSSTDRMKTDIKIISEGMDPSVSDTMHIYVKNTGRMKITSTNLVKSDVYIANSSTTYKCKYSTGQPSWQYAIKDGNGDSTWDPGETLDIIITAGGYDFHSDGQSVTVALYNGVATHEEYSL
ncbi:MAG TPA: hypothetical protein VK436_13650 [Methanocella sp.]|nr:hypothetical protein [Methanocella sp.]